MGRIECFKRDAYHVGKHSRPTPPLAHVILFIYYIFDLVSDRWSFARVLVCFPYFSNNYFKFTVLCWNTCFVKVGRDL